MTFQPEFRPMVPLTNSLASAPSADSAPPDPTAPLSSESSPPCPCTDDNANEPTEETRISLDFPLENGMICQIIVCWTRDVLLTSLLRTAKTYSYPEISLYPQSAFTRALRWTARVTRAAGRDYNPFSNKAMAYLSLMNQQ